MSVSGAQVTAECVDKFNELKLNKKLKFIIYKMSDDYKVIEVEEASEDPDWDVFREKLIKAQSKSKTGKLGKGPRFAVYDFHYDLQSGEGSRNKIIFLAWSPDDAGIQVNDADEIEYQTMLNRVSKGLA